MCLLPAGTDPHSFSPAPSDVRRIAQAELVLASGFELEPWLEKIVQNSGTKALVRECSVWISAPLMVEGGEEAELHGAAAAHNKHDAHGAHGEHCAHGEHDPHWWHSVRAAREVATGICKELKAMRPEAAEGLEARLAVLIEELTQLEAWARLEVARIPVEQRHLITSHDAFGYFARELGFQVHSLNGMNPGAETDARTLARLIDFVVKHRIRAIFPDNTENPRVLAAMIAETGAKAGGVLFVDGLGARGGPASDYCSMYRHNLKTIVEGLTGQASTEAASRRLFPVRLAIVPALCVEARNGVFRGLSSPGAWA